MGERDGYRRKLYRLLIEGKVYMQLPLVKNIPNNGNVRLALCYYLLHATDKKQQ